MRRIDVLHGSLITAERHRFTPESPMPIVCTSPRSTAQILLLFASLVACGDGSSEVSAPSSDADAGAEGATHDAADTDETPDAALDAPSDSADRDAADDAPADQDAEFCPPSDNPQWSIATVDDTPGFKARVALAVGDDQRLRLAYNVASSSDGWSEFELRVAEQVGQTFEHQTVVSSDGFSNEFPTVAVDAQGVTHVVYNRFVPSENQIDVFLVSGTLSGGFSPPVNLTNTPSADENGAVIAVGSDGVLHVVYMARTAIPDKPGKYTYATGYVAYDGAPKDAAVLAADTLLFTGQPEQAIALDAAGRVHVVYLRPGVDPSHGVACHRRRDEQGWGSETMVTSDAVNVTGVSVAATGTDAVHFVYAKGKVETTLTYRRLDGLGLGPEQALTTSADDRAYYLGLSPAGADDVYVAFRRLLGSNADVFFIAGQQGSFGPEEPVTATPSEDEQTATLAVGRCGEAYLAFTENLLTAPNGRVMVATRR